MKFIREKNGNLIVSLASGDDIRLEVEKLAVEQKIGGAQVSAIGSLENPELGYYNLETKTYRKRAFPGRWETTLVGNISVYKEKPVLHAHVVISGPGFTAHGGHLFRAKVSTITEMMITPFENDMPRIVCAPIGVTCWEPACE